MRSRVKNVSLRKEEEIGRETVYACITGPPRMSEGRESQAGRKRSDSDSKQQTPLNQCIYRVKLF